MSQNVKILKTEILNKDKSINKRPFFALSKNRKIIVFLLILLISLIAFIPKEYYKSGIRKLLAMAGIYTEEIRTIEITSNDYNNPGGFKITKSAEWISTDEVQITFDVTSKVKMGNNYKDLILVLDTSDTMAGERIEEIVSNAKELVTTLLSDSNNRVALIKYNTTSQILSNFTNDEETVIDLLDTITTTGNTNYNAALLDINTIMSNYSEQENRDVVALILTDGYPTEETHSEIATYTMLKDNYPYLTINAVQYEMGNSIVEEVIAISDNQLTASKATLNNILLEAALNPVYYEEFKIEDYINNDYFDINSVNDITTTIGSATIEEDSGEKKIIWNLGTNSYSTGAHRIMTIKLDLNDSIPSNKVFYPTNNKEVISYTLDDIEQIITRTDTPVLTNTYSITYLTNTPDNCTLSSIPSEDHIVFETIYKNTNQLNCSGYLFKGWKIDEEDNSDITHINEDLFIMPGHDVTIRAEWSSHSISKSMNGTVNTFVNLYKVLEDEAKNDGLAEEYTGSHNDSFTKVPTDKIYYYKASNSSEAIQVQNKNNVIFGGYCWQMFRTTDTGGVKMIYNGKAVDNQCLDTRSNQIGYEATIIEDLDSPYWYGTDYHYDEQNNLFTLSGTLQQTTWSEVTAPGLKGKYTCRSTSQYATCQTLYLVNLYYDSTGGAIIPIRANTNYSLLGKTQYNVYSDSSSYVGYMTGDIIKSNSSIVKEQDLSDYMPILGTQTFDSNNYYSQNVSRNGNTYTLINPVRGSTISGNNYSGFYTFDSPTITSGNNPIYIVNRENENNFYFVQFETGLQLSDYNLWIGDSVTDNGNGTYTVNNTSTISLNDWYNNYTTYKNKYTCGPYFTNTCTAPMYIIETLASGYNYLFTNIKRIYAKSKSGTTLIDTVTLTDDEWYNEYRDYYWDYRYTCNTNTINCTAQNIRKMIFIDDYSYYYIDNHYYGTSVTWNGTNYTVNNVVDFDDYTNMNVLSNHHYFCLESGSTTCNTVAYGYYYNEEYNTDTNGIKYVVLTNGVTDPTQLLSDMYTKNTADSNIKVAIEAWYKKYLLPYDDYIEDTIYCNNRSVQNLYGWDPNGGTINRRLEFKDNVPNSDLSCSNITDKFSISNPQARLNYKIGLMTTSEAYILNSDRLRYTNNEYWLSSPNYFHYYATFVNAIDTDGSISYANVNESGAGVRPVISLKPETDYYSGDGSMANPYIVDLPE